MGGKGGQGPTQVLADQLTLSQRGEGGHIMPTTLQLASPPPPGFSDHATDLGWRES